MIIDCRCRPPLEGFTQLLKANFYLRTMGERLWYFGHDHSPSYAKESMELFWKEFEDAGISKGVMTWRDIPTMPRASPGNDYIAQIAVKYPDKLIGVGAVSPSREDAVKEVERAIKELKLKGISVDPGALRPPLRINDPKLKPIYEKCLELDVPVFVFTSNLIGEGIHWANPMEFQDICREFSPLRICVVHGCWPRVLEIIAVANRFKNLYIMPGLYSFFPGAIQYLEGGNYAIEDQLVFASAYPVNPMKAAVDLFEKFPWRDQEHRDKVMYKNAQRLLKI